MSCRTRTLRIGPLPLHCSPIQHSRVCRPAAPPPPPDCPLAYASHDLQTGYSGQVYTENFGTATGITGAATYEWIGPLPTGLDFGSDGILTGTINPGQAGVWEFDVTVTDDLCNRTAHFILTIYDACPVVHYTIDTSDVVGSTVTTDTIEQGF